MIPVYQTTFGSPGGNCLSACVASLLELPIEEVPYFGDDNQLPPLQAFLDAYGMTSMCMRWDPAVWMPQGYCILGGQARGVDGKLWPHAVVGLDGEFVHNPHPAGGTLEVIEDVTFLLPKNPALWRLRSPEEAPCGSL